MRIKKMFQGTIPENKIVGIETDSQTDAYNCEYINNIVNSLLKGTIKISPGEHSIVEGKWNTPAGTCKIFTDGIGWKGGMNTSGNDSAWIRFDENTANDGMLEIATGDDGGTTSKEKMLFRQYNTANQVTHEIQFFLRQSNGDQWVLRDNTNGVGMATNGDIYMNWYGGWLSTMYNNSIVKNSSNISSVQDSGSYLHVNRQSGGAKGINWWDSDIRLKGNIKDSKENGLDIINQIEHKSFTKYKEVDKKEVQDTFKIGYIANQLQEIDPQLVFGVEQEDIDPILNVNTNVLIPYMTKAIQELSKKNKELEARIIQLENNIGG